MTVFWVVVPCSLVEVFPTFQRSLLPPSSGRWVTYCPDDEGSKHLWNVGQFLPNYTAQHPRRQSSSYSPWEPEISTTFLLTAHVFWLTFNRCKTSECFMWVEVLLKTELGDPLNINIRQYAYFISQVSVCMWNSATRVYFNYKVKSFLVHQLTMFLLHMQFSHRL
jgi:hypothetical protein